MPALRPLAAGRAEVVLFLRTVEKTEKKAVNDIGSGIKKVLMLSWEYPPRIVGGIARHVDELSHALAVEGLEVDVLTAFHPGAPREEVFPGKNGGQVRILRAGAQPVNPLDFICEIHQLDFGLLERLFSDGIERLASGYDLLHAHDWLVAFAARTLRHGLGLPLVATIHATEAGRQNGLYTPLQHYIHSVEWLLSYDACRVICCSQAMASEIQTSLRTPADKLRIIPNGIDPERMKCADSAEALRAFKRRWAADDERIIFFVGRLVREKGVEILLDAMPTILAQHPSARLVIAGNGFWGHLADRASALGVGHKVTFPGFVSEKDLARFYAVAEVAAFPSLYEPFGIVALEAMAAGVPVVTSDIGGFREVVRHDRTGLQTWANNPGSLAWGINRLLGDPALVARLRKNGRAEIRRKFGWGTIARNTIQVFEDAAALQQPPEKTAGQPTWPALRPRYLTADLMRN